MHSLILLPTIIAVYCLGQLCRTSKRPMLTTTNSWLARLFPERAYTVASGWSIIPSPFKGQGGTFIEVKVTTHGRIRTCSADLFTSEDEGEAGYGWLEPQGIALANQLQPMARRLLDITLHTHFNSLNGKNIHPELAELDQQFVSTCGSIR